MWENTILVLVLNSPMTFVPGQLGVVLINHLIYSDDTHKCGIFLNVSQCNISIFMHVSMFCLMTMSNGNVKN